MCRIYPAETLTARLPKGEVPILFLFVGNETKTLAIGLWQ
jgi:hypothetical protein